MSPIYEILLFTSFVLGLYLSVVLFLTRHYNKLLNRLLGVIVFSISVFYLIFYLIIKKWILEVPFLARSFIPLLYLAPGCCYLYVRCFITDQLRLRKKDFLHFLPFTLELILMLPYLFSPLSEKLNLAKAMVSNIDAYFDYRTGFIPEKYHMLFRTVLIMIYLFFVWKIMLSKKYQSFAVRNKDTYPLAIKWILYFVLFISFLAIFSSLLKWQMLFKGTITPLQGSPFAVFTLLSFIGLLVYGLANPVILYGLPHFVPLPTNPTDTKTGHDLPTVTISPALPIEEQLTSVPKAPFEEKRMEEYEQLIRQYMADKKPYCNPDFNIASLSKGMNIPQHHLAYIFKYQLKQSFVDYRSQLRVDYVKVALQQGKDKELTLEAIGESAGFSSRSTFFVTFKKITGQSPSQYLELLQANG